jgi:hypothetical protein
MVPFAVLLFTISSLSLWEMSLLFLVFYFVLCPYKVVQSKQAKRSSAEKPSKLRLDELIAQNEDRDPIISSASSYY